MTNRERVIAAIRHEKPDRTPHNVGFTEGMLEKIIAYTGNKDFLNTIDNHISMTSLTKPQTPVAGRPECFADEYGVVWDKSGVDKDIGVIAEAIIKNEEQLAAYTPPPIDEDFIRKNCEKLMKTKGDNFAIANLGFSLFERAWTLCGMEDLLCYMLTAPDAVKAFLDKIVKQNIQRVKIALEYDIDCVLFGDDWGQQKGLIMGKPLWVEMLKPCLAATYGEVKAAGRFVAQHSCGDIREILDDLIEIGLDVYQTFQPEIYDLKTYKQKLYGRLTIWGGISTQVDLPFKSPDEIYALTRSTIEIMGQDGGYIAAPTHDVPGDVPPENVCAMVLGFRA